MSHEPPPFYGEKISRIQQQEMVNKILDKHRSKPVGDEVLKQIHEELCIEKHEGRLTIPFKVLLRKDESGIRGDQIEVLLDTKV